MANVDFPVEAVCEKILEDFLEDETTKVQDVVELLGLEGFGTYASDEEIMELVEALGLTGYVMEELGIAHSCGSTDPSPIGLAQCFPELPWDLVKLCMRRI